MKALRMYVNARVGGWPQAKLQNGHFKKYGGTRHKPTSSSSTANQTSHPASISA